MTPVTAADIAASDRIRAEQAKGTPPSTSVKTRGKRIHVYVCPTPGCPDYYGSGNTPKLEEEIVGQYGANFEPKPKEDWHSRAQCPTCRASGKKVERVRVELFVPIEALTVADAA